MGYYTLSFYLLIFAILVSCSFGYKTTPTPQSQEIAEMRKILDRYFAYPIYEDGNSVNGEIMDDFQIGDVLLVEKIRIAPITYMIFQNSPIINLEDLRFFIESAYFSNFIRIRGDYRFFQNHYQNEIKGNFFGLIKNVKLNISGYMSLGSNNNPYPHITNTSIRWDKPIFNESENYKLFLPGLEREIERRMKSVFTRRFKDLLNNRFKNNSTAVARSFYKAYIVSKHFQKIFQENNLYYESQMSTVSTEEPTISPDILQMELETITTTPEESNFSSDDSKKEFEKLITIDPTTVTSELDIEKVSTVSPEITQTENDELNKTDTETPSAKESIVFSEESHEVEIQSNNTGSETMSIKSSTITLEIPEMEKMQSETKLHMMTKRWIYNRDLPLEETTHSKFTTQYEQLEEQKDMFNELVDRIMISVRQNIKDKEKEEIKLPKIEETFSTKLGFLPIMGKFQASQGTFKNLSTLKRTSDVEIEKLDQAIRIKSAFGLEKAEILYHLYQLQLWNMNLKGFFRGNVFKNSAGSSITVDLSQNQCKLSLEKFHLEDFSQIRIEISGYGSYDKLASFVSTWVLNKFNSKVVKSLDDIFSEAIRKQLKLIECRIG